jgi:ribosomal protein S18 acetylase RimI-like enzyme
MATPTDILIRPCRPQECASVLALWGRAYETPGTTDTLPEIAHLVSEHQGSLLVAVINHAIVGTAIAAWDGWRGNVYRLAVLPEYRRRGVARALVEEAQRRLEARGARRLSALVDHGSPNAVAFWESLHDIGYERDPRMTRYIKTISSKPGARG